MAQAGKKIRVASNPHRTKKRSAAPMAAKKKSRKRNPTAKARNSSAKHRTTKKTRKRNPQSMSIVPRRKKARRNPDFLTGIIGSPKAMVIGAVAGLSSAVITRQLPQLILKANNVGWKGYGGNALAGLIATYAAGRLAGADAGKAAFVGATVIILDRVLTEKFSPLGQYLALSGSGDATATGTLGTIADGYFIHPTIVDAQGRPVIPHEITDAALAAVLKQYPNLATQQGNGGPRPQQQMQGVGNRFRSRFARAA